MQSAKTTTDHRHKDLALVMVKCESDYSWTDILTELHCVCPL